MLCAAAGLPWQCQVATPNAFVGAKQCLAVVLMQGKTHMHGHAGAPVRLLAALGLQLQRQLDGPVAAVREAAHALFALQPQETQMTKVLVLPTTKLMRMIQIHNAINELINA